MSVAPEILSRDARRDGAETLRAPQVAPSLLSADHARLGEQVAAVMDAGARVIHVDVMDGHFVPPITVGPPVVEAIGEQVHGAGGVVDVHLMIEAPEQQIDAFAEAGADVITIHHEATAHAHYVLAAVRDRGCLAGLAINPATPAEAVAPLANSVDMVLCMTVNPGWGGQRFIEEALSKVRRLAGLLPDSVAIEVDGGVDERHAAPCVAAGASVLVAGSAVFGAGDPAASWRAIDSVARFRDRVPERNPSH